MKKIIFSIITLLFIVSCEDFLEERPKDRLTENNFYSNLEDAVASVNAIYAPVRDNFRTLNTLMLDIEADYANGRGSTMPLGEYQGFDQTNINRAAEMWLRFYQSIRNANISIENISNMSISETDKSSLIAEARFMRAFCYFHLVQNFGAVPIYLETVNEDTKRKPVEEVYQAIVSNLQAGENTLPSTPSQYGRPSKWSAMALL